MPMNCLSCRCPKVEALIDFGQQPPSNRFEQVNVPETDVHKLVLGLCHGCGLLQLIDPMPPAIVKPRFDWLTYNEPEAHLDVMVDKLAQLPGINSNSRVLGCTYKDNSTLERFKGRGLNNVVSLSPATDLGITESCAGLETIQETLSSVCLRHLGQFDLVIARHLLEHAHHPRELLNALRSITRPGGYIVLEMPDCTKFIKNCDYCFVWEEHITYFCRQTLENLMLQADLHVQELDAYNYPMEDSLVVVAANSSPGPKKSVEPKASMFESAQKFARLFSFHHQRLRESLQISRQAGKKVAVFGAGHLAARFINFFNLSELLECAIDDNVQKQNLLMPASRLPIRNSSYMQNSIDLCLSSLNPESEQKVRKKLHPFLEKGGQFSSIFRQIETA